MGGWGTALGSASSPCAHAAPHPTTLPPHGQSVPSLSVSAAPCPLWEAQGHTVGIQQGASSQRGGRAQSVGGAPLREHLESPVLGETGGQCKQPFVSTFLRERRRYRQPRRAFSRQADNYVFLEAGLMDWLRAELGMGSEACRLQTGRGSGSHFPVQF